MAAKVALFGHLPNKCLTCDEPFDKLNREQVMSWNVVVRQEEEKSQPLLSSDVGPTHKKLVKNIWRIKMQFHQIRKKGFIFNEDVAEELRNIK